MSLYGKVAIVTGGARGIGYAVARRLCADRAITIIADIAGHEEAAESLRAMGHDAHAIKTDVSSDHDVGHLVADTIRRFDGVHILVNNAALTAGLRPGPFEDQNPETWKRIYDVNVVGAFRACRAVSPHMRAQRWGRIVNLTSDTALKGVPGVLHYVATKGALVAMTRVLANELGSDNIVCNAVAPGLTVTEALLEAPEIGALFRQGAIASRVLKRNELAEDVANVVAFLASDDAGFVTGQTLVVDGGSAS